MYSERMPPQCIAILQLRNVYPIPKCFSFSPSLSLFYFLLLSCSLFSLLEIILFTNPFSTLCLALLYRWCMSQFSFLFCPAFSPNKISHSFLFPFSKFLQTYLGKKWPACTSSFCWFSFTICAEGKRLHNDHQMLVEQWNISQIMCDHWTCRVTRIMVVTKLGSHNLIWDLLCWLCWND